jgi:hypothetical protein
MATSSYAKTLLGSLPADLKVALGRVVEYVFDRTLAFGPIDATVAETATQNFAGRYVKLVTSATANAEFSVTHGLGRVPNVWWQVGSPITVNSQSVALTVSRAADAGRVYFTSASTTATTWVYLE